MTTATATHHPAGAASDAPERPEHLQLLEDAILALESEGTFRAWLDFRAKFHKYSPWNSLLIQMQCPTATAVAGYKQWIKVHNRQVRKGEKGIVILAPMTRRIKDDAASSEDAKRTIVLGFRGARVFDIAQTDGDPVPKPFIPEPLTGDSHAQYIPMLIAHANELGYTVSYEDLFDCEGYCDYTHKHIAIQNAAAPNAQLRILVHELIHAHGTTYIEFGRKLAETITDSATYVVCRGLGLDITNTVAPYIAGWSNRELRENAIGYIDHYAAELERALGLHDRSTRQPKPIAETEVVL